MNSAKIEIGEYYRLRNSPNYGWIKVIDILYPLSGENTHPFFTIKCEHTIN
jgi:hypothetical protein